EHLKLRFFRCRVKLSFIVPPCMAGRFKHWFPRVCIQEAETNRSKYIIPRSLCALIDVTRNRIQSYDTFWSRYNQVKMKPSGQIHRFDFVRDARAGERGVVGPARRGIGLRRLPACTPRTCQESDCRHSSQCRLREDT